MSRNAALRNVMILAALLGASVAMAAPPSRHAGKTAALQAQVKDSDTKIAAARTQNAALQAQVSQMEQRNAAQAKQHTEANLSGPAPTIPTIRLHDLRHTHATLGLAAGVPPKVMQERLGHSSIQITMDLYSHVIPGMQADAASKIGGLLRKKAQ